MSQVNRCFLTVPWKKSWKIAIGVERMEFLWYKVTGLKNIPDDNDLAESGIRRNLGDPGDIQVGLGRRQRS